MKKRPSAKKRRPAAAKKRSAARKKPSAAAKKSAAAAKKKKSPVAAKKRPAAPTKRPAASAVGGNSTWGAQPGSGDWNTAGNWNPAAVPTETATFGASSQTGIGFAPNSSATIQNIAFAGGAPPYSLSFNAPAPNAPALTVTGQGLTNVSGTTQQIVVASSAQNYKQPQLKFMNSASAGGSSMSYSVGPATPAAAGGGVIGFYGTSTAGSANFIVTTGAGAPPKDNSTVGGEVGFSDSSTAGTATFTVYGSTSTVNLGDTFGNTVFHDTSNAGSALFTNIGGTLSGCDGGNTQFFNNANAANGVFHNLGGSVLKANGGDVAFDGTANAAGGHFHNYAATADGGYGGVTSFNNNAPPMDPSVPGASAGNGLFYNYGAKASGQGGGHTFFTGKFGSAIGANGTFVNYGAAVAGNASIAGRTVFSITLGQKISYRPDAGAGVFWNFPGTVAGAPGGYTQFAVYPAKGAATLRGIGPTAGNATCVSLGAVVQGAQGGQTEFKGTSTAAQAQLTAVGGINGGEGGAITFSDQSSGGTAAVQLLGNGTLDISGHAAPGVTIGTLAIGGGIIVVTVGSATTCLAVSGSLMIEATPMAFSFKSGSGFATGTAYTILTAPNLSNATVSQFSGNTVNGASPTFNIVGNNLQVTFG
jgi:hypothetical protein